MFGHGQIEGFEEKYGMEYRRSYRNETPDLTLVERHEREIFPLMKRRNLFSGSADFCLYDLYAQGGINENVFAYSNRSGEERSLVFYNNSYYETAGWIHRGSVAIPQKDGSFRRDTLAQALGLHREDRYFVLFLEQRSGLWFIRSSKDVAERGLFASLKGYEAQVFVDIHEVEDGSGRWARLNAELNGRGVRDLPAAIRDIFLGELYGAFGDIFKPEHLEGLYGAFTGKTGPVPDRGEEVIRSLEEPVLAFINAAALYLDGAGGRYDPFIIEGERPVIESGAIRENLSLYLRRFMLLSSKNPSSPKPDKSLAPFLKALGDQIEADPRISAYALGYGVLALLRPIIGGGTSGAKAGALADHWFLDYKLREIYHALGMPGDEVRRITELMKTLLYRTSPKDAGPYWAGRPGEALILENYGAEDFRRILGVNLYDDIVWYKKEAFEEALAFIPLFLSLEGDAAFEEAALLPQKDRGGKQAGIDMDRWLDRLGIIADLSGQYRRAEAESGYRLDGFLTALSKSAGIADSGKKKGAPKKAAFGNKGAKPK
jgi:hypothetical protein